MHINKVERRGWWWVNKRSQTDGQSGIERIEMWQCARRTKGGKNRRGKNERETSEGNESGKRISS